MSINCKQGIRERVSVPSSIDGGHYGKQTPASIPDSVSIASKITHTQFISYSYKND